MILKIYISGHLFDREVDIIELNQKEWKSDEFMIYISKNSRCINAVYTKDESKLEIQ